jgi:hypothetical protein
MRYPKAFPEYHQNFDQEQSGNLMTPEEPKTKDSFRANFSDAGTPYATRNHILDPNLASAHQEI